jgi:hypothetical protein
MRQRLYIKRPTRGSKSNPIYVVKVRPKVQRPSPLPAKILDPTQIGISGLEEIFCLASISAAGLAGRAFSPACGGGREGAGIRPMVRHRPAHPATAPNPYNIQHVINIPHNKGKNSWQPPFGHVQACPGHPDNRMMCPALPRKRGGRGGGRDKPGDDAVSCSPLLVETLERVFREHISQNTHEIPLRQRASAVAKHRHRTRRFGSTEIMVNLI